MHITHAEEDKNRVTHNHGTDYRHKQSPKRFQRERQVMSGGMTAKRTADFSPATADDSEQRHKVFRVKTCQPRT